jgi:1-deoxy-D-xylulose-5-phosphate reductoisomerase
MRLPIQLALSWPERWGGTVEALDPARLAGLTFRPIEPARFPAFAAALAAGRAGGTAPCAVNAADEVAVEAFLAGAIGIAGVPEVVWRVLDGHASAPVESLEQLAEVDRAARSRARAAVSETRAAAGRVAP